MIVNKIVQRLRKTTKANETVYLQPVTLFQNWNRQHKNATIYIMGKG